MHPSEAHTFAARKRRRIVLGVALFVVGLVLGPGAFAAGLFHILTSLGTGEQFAAPGQHTLHIDEPGRFTIWHETAGVFQGQPHSTSRFPRNMQIDVLDPRGQPLSLQSNTNATMTIGSTQRRSLLSFQASETGDHTIIASGSDESAVLYIAPELFRMMFTAIFATTCAAFLGMLLLLAGIVTFILGLTMRPPAQPATSAIA